MDNITQHHQHHHPHHHHQCHHHQQLTLHPSQDHHQQQLIQAVKEDDQEQVEHLLTKGVSADVRDIEGRSLLYWACCLGHVDICRCLLLTGCDVTVKGKAGTTALMACADNGHETCVQLLLQHRSIRLDDTSDRGDTALHMAAYRGFPSIVHLLCMAGANLGLHNVNGQTPLGVAFIEDNKSCIQILNSYGQGDTDRKQRTQSSAASVQHKASSSSTHLLSTPNISPSTNGSHPKGYSPNSLQLENVGGVNERTDTGGGDYLQDTDRLASSDSALGLSLSVQSPSSLSPQSLHLDVLPDESSEDSSNSQGCNSFDTNHNQTTLSSENLRSIGNSPCHIIDSSRPTHALFTNLHSPVEADERVFINGFRSAALSHAQHDNIPHSDSGHFSNGPSGFHEQPSRKDVEGFDCPSYDSSISTDVRDRYQAPRTSNHYSFQEPLTPSFNPDLIHSTSLTVATDVDDISGPPAMCYSPAMEQNNTKSIYTNAFNPKMPSSSVVQSTSKCILPVNNLSSSKENKENVRDSTLHNAAFPKPDPTQNYVPNISPKTMPTKSQRVNPEGVIFKDRNPNETEVLPGLKVSSYLESLQMKVVMLDDSLEKERASNGVLQSENKKLREENENLKAVIQTLTQKLAKFS